jgi:hypothetical protein
MPSRLRQAGIEFSRRAKITIPCRRYPNGKRFSPCSQGPLLRLRDWFSWLCPLILAG